MLSDLLFKYFAISCDMLDFLTILQDNTLIKSDPLVYATLSVWSWSCIQFFIFIPKYEDEEKRKFNAYITNSLISTLFLDLPFLGIRIAVIFFFGSHNYNSYFFAIKNICMIFLQIIRIRATFLERHIRENKYARNLSYRKGTDIESNGALFDANELAKRKFISQRLANNNFNVDINIQDDNVDLNNEKTNNIPRLPRTIETVKLHKKVAFEKASNPNSVDNLNVTQPQTLENNLIKNNFKANLLKKSAQQPVENIQNEDLDLGTAVQSILKKPNLSVSANKYQTNKQPIIHTEI